MAGMQRFVAVLNLFGEDRAALTVQQMADALDVPASTLYRTVRELVASNFLAPAADAHYRLGTAFLRFDRLIRLTDPLMTVGARILADLTRRAGIDCVGLISSLYGNEVMCISDMWSGAPTFRSSYERGRPMPLTRGATSKVILAGLPARRLRKLLEDMPEPPSGGRDAFRAQLQKIRRQGYCVSHGEIDSGLFGIAAPIVAPDGQVTSSLSLVAESAALTPAREAELVPRIVAAARSLGLALAGTAKEPA